MQSIEEENDGLIRPRVVCKTFFNVSCESPLKRTHTKNCAEVYESEKWKETPKPNRKPSRIPRWGTTPKHLTEDENEGLGDDYKEGSE